MAASAARGGRPRATVMRVASVVLATAVVLAVVACEPVDAKTSRQRRQEKADKGWKNRKKDCETNTCAHLPVYENDNCVNECTSEGCYRQVYAAEPLEPGEVDSIRNKEFQSCLRKETRERARQKKAAAAVEQQDGPSTEGGDGSGSNGGDTHRSGGAEGNER